MVALEEVAPLVRRPIAVVADETYGELGIRSHGKGTFHKPLVRGYELGEKRVFRIEAGDLLFNIIFAWEGAVAVAGLNDGEKVGSHRFLSCVCDPKRADARFLNLFFKTEAGFMQLRAASPGGAGRNRTLSLNGLAQLRVPLPALTEQQDIVGRLDGVAERIAKRAAAVKRVDVELEATLQAMFHRITAGSRITRLGEVAPLVRRAVTVDAEQTYTEIGVRSFFRGTFQRRTVLGAEFTWQNLFTVQTEDLVFSNIMAWEGAVAVARAKDKGCVGNHRMLTCEVDPLGAVPIFLLFYFQQPAGLAQIVAASPSSIARNRTLGPAALADLRVPLPSLDAQKDFATLHVKVQAVLAAQRDAGEELDKLLPALLHEAFVAGPATTSRAAA